jgi:hypothetical protein
MRRLAAVLLLSGLAACSAEKKEERAIEKVEKAQDTFCADLDAFAGAVNQVATLDANSSVSDLKSSAAAAEQAYAKLQSAAAHLEKAQGKAMVAAYDAYKQQVGTISSSTSLGDAAVQVAGLRTSLGTTIDDIRTTECAVGTN